MYGLKSVYKTFIITMQNFRNPRTVVPIHEIVTLYNSGFSVKRLASHFGCSRNVISNRLDRVGISARNRSESMYLRMSQTDAKGRLDLVAGANKAMRNSTKEQRANRLQKAAISKQKSGVRIGILEDFVFDSMKPYNPISQKPFMAYNIDIACGTVAIEVHNSSGFPHATPHHQKRIINLLKGGYTVVYIKMRAIIVINEVAMNKLRFICEQSSTNPSISGKYWVIRGTGELAAVGELDGDNLSVIKAPEHLFNIFNVNSR